MPRKRIYESEADKQKAWRDRHKLRAETLEALVAAIVQAADRSGCAKLGNDLGDTVEEQAKRLIARLEESKVIVADRAATRRKTKIDLEKSALESSAGAVDSRPETQEK